MDGSAQTDLTRAPYQVRYIIVALLRRPGIMVRRRRKGQPEAEVPQSKKKRGTPVQQLRKTPKMSARKPRNVRAPRRFSPSGEWTITPNPRADFRVGRPIIQPAVGAPLQQPPPAMVNTYTPIAATPGATASPALAPPPTTTQLPPLPTPCPNIFAKDGQQLLERVGTHMEAVQLTPTTPLLPQATANGVADMQREISGLQARIAQLQQATPHPAPTSANHAEGRPQLGNMFEVQASQIGLHGASVQAMTSDALPLYTLLTKENRNKIASDDFIEFSSLLRDQAAEKSYAMKPQETEAGLVPALQEVAPKGKPLNLLGWVRAFARFMSTYTQSHPGEVQHLLIHLENVLQLAADRGDWTYYDRQFRLQKAAGGYSYGKTRIETYAKALTRQQNQASGNFRPATGTSTKTPTSIPRPYCFDYHTAGKRCSNYPCRFLHRCFKCHADHPAAYCKVQPQPQPISNTNQPPSTKSK